jgi:hypothetical protein
LKIPFDTLFKVWYEKTAFEKKDRWKKDDEQAQQHEKLVVAKQP